MSNNTYKLYLYVTEDGDPGTMILNSDISEAVINAISSDYKEFVEYDFDPNELEETGFKTFGDTDDLESIKINYNKNNDVNTITGMSLYIKGHDFAEYMSNATNSRFTYHNDYVCLSSDSDSDEELNTYIDLNYKSNEFNVISEVMDNGETMHTYHNTNNRISNHTNNLDSEYLNMYDLSSDEGAGPSNPNDEFIHENNNENNNEYNVEISPSMLDPEYVSEVSSLIDEMDKFNLSLE